MVKWRGRPGPYLKEVELRREKLSAEEAAAYPFSLPAVRNLGVLPLHPKVTFFLGENGTGKSTVLEAVAAACGLNPEGGSRNHHFATRETHSPLYKHLRVARIAATPPDSYFLRAESFYNVASYLDDIGGAWTHTARGSLHAQSHGESFMSLFQLRLRGQGLYFMDEPEAALSPSRQLQFLAVLHDYCRQGSQFLIATHSPIIAAYPDAWIYSFTDSGLVRSEYAETEHYRVSRAFLLNPKTSLKNLFGEEGEPDQGE